jgi:hypothetical protein
MSEYAGPELAEDFKKADGSKVFDAGELICFEEWDKPPLFPVVEWRLLGRR